ASYPLRGQMALLAFTYSCYMAVVAITAWEISAAVLFIRLGVLGVVAFIGCFMSHELMKSMLAQAESRAESERRAGLLANVARAARSVNNLETDRVLAEVVDCASSLGFEAANFAFFDESNHTYRVGYGVGLPEEYRDSVHPYSVGMPGMVRGRRATVIVDDYSSLPNAIPVLARAGFSSVIAAPVMAQGRMRAVLVSGTRSRTRIAPQVVEAFELLAALAGRALENAARFEDEQRTVERLAELDQLKSDFLSNVSHEIRTPLTVIAAAGSTLDRLHDRLPEETKHEILSRLNANVLALDGVISTLLDFSRLDAGKLAPEVESFDLGESVRAAAARLAPLFKEHALDEKTELGLTVMADRVLMDRVIENLVANAAKHTPFGTAVEISARREDGHVIVCVSDNGPGIPSGELAHLSERFFRGGHPDRRTTRGLGLGLALVSEILRLHSTSLEISSRAGTGSEFGFRLPFHPSFGVNGRARNGGARRAAAVGF
ncbi:MAG: ATP-binding protein, partial [Actinomycetota bacterium]